MSWWNWSLFLAVLTYSAKQTRFPQLSNVYDMTVCPFLTAETFHPPPMCPLHLFYPVVITGPDSPSSKKFVAERFVAECLLTPLSHSDMPSFEVGSENPSICYRRVPLSYRGRCLSLSNVSCGWDLSCFLFLPAPPNRIAFLVPLEL